MKSLKNGKEAADTVTLTMQSMQSMQWMQAQAQISDTLNKSISQCLAYHFQYVA
ncbi:hypothetical protein RGU70_06360 [Herbaspirillum sp. RTI4]|uniref:hypothetical protein n=1 Tax=Herbaspirillum sp. RTI4 TaxID=3048640 RepID=UPI002AB3F35C|nr:hypothetical protein [Herbaspirillum sp. RTI4]MDY7577936.1 hypothetical protein [Herbaspirillum sp. RTI4]MEA9981618.1 hypothetical protein [Herbaspirillum sp. RTI4]